MKAAFLAVLLGLLMCDASGVLAFVSPEVCTDLTDTIPDGKCPPQCARCACGVPSLVPAQCPVIAAPFTSSEPAPALLSSTPDAPPHEVLHVPR